MLFASQIHGCGGNLTVTFCAPTDSTIGACNPGSNVGVCVGVGVGVRVGVLDGVGVIDGVIETVGVAVIVAVGIAVGGTILTSAAYKFTKPLP